jgi:N utilization substance protein A
MTTATYDTEMIRNINMFESITDVEARDAIIKEDEAYFVVPEGKAGMAIGKGGEVVQKVQNKLDRDVKIYEYNDNLGAFINNLLFQQILEEWILTATKWRLMYQETTKGVL